VSNDILKLPNGLLELEKPFKLFDMKKFQQNVNREMKRTYPDRRKLVLLFCSSISAEKLLLLLYFTLMTPTQKAGIGPLWPFMP
jgi:hypothetical protein